MAKELGRLQCQHTRENGRGNDAIFLPDGQVLDLCGNCIKVVHLAVLQDIIKAALQDTFSATIGDLRL